MSVKQLCGWSCLMMLILAIAQRSDVHADAPVLTPNGRIICGAKSIWHKPDYGRLTLCIDNDAIGTLYEMFNFGKSDISAVFFLDIKTITKENSITYTAVPRDSTSSEEKLGKYSLELALRDDGLVKVEGICTLDDPKLEKARYTILDLPSYLKLTGHYVKGGKKIEFGGKSAVALDAGQLEGSTLTFFPENPDRTFVIKPVSLSSVRVDGSRISFHAGVDHRMSFLMDLRSTGGEAKSSEVSRNGIDFWGVDRLHLPEYPQNSNMLRNPSFEAGFRYWGVQNYVHDLISMKHGEVYEIDDTVARTGSRSLRIKPLPMRAPSSLGHLPTPFNAGEKWTYSFYAKGSADSGLTVGAWGRGQHSQLFPENVLTFNVNREWQRFTIPFTAKERFSTIYLEARSPGGADGHVWIDDVQLEQGDVTDFKQPPVTAALISSARGNFLQFGKEPNFKLQLQARPNSSGEARLSVEDFFFKTIFTGSYPFKTDGKGNATIDLAELSSKIRGDGLRGIYVVAGEFTVPGLDKPYKDFFRFSVMDFLENTHKNKNLFNITYVYSHQSGGPHFERALERERAIGFGSICYDWVKFANDNDYDMDRERVELAKKYGFDFMGRPVLKLHDGEGGEISEEQGKVKMTGIKNRINPTAEELKEFEAICELKARRRPWNKIWWFTGESNPGVMPLESHPDAFAKFLLATYRGIKRGNPNAEVLIEGGPWTLDPENGAKWVERYIQDTKRLDPTIQFDGAAAHHYRDFPENPDLDSDIAAFLAMLDRNGVGHWPFHVNEGGNYAPFNIPQEGMSPYIMHSANSWYIGPLSYHYGRAERISAAFTARNWLIGLKYADRLACMQDFQSTNRAVDYDFTARAYEKIPNTLGRLLGNATFQRDIRFALSTRCYVFKDDKTGVPIAAIWGHKESVDRWKENPPVYSFNFGDQQVRFIDLMENEVSYPSDSTGRTAIPISSFPFFVVGTAGGEEALCSAIATAVAADGANTPVLTAAAYPKADGQIAVVFTNPIEKEFAGEARLTINGVEKAVPLKVPSRGNSEILLSPPETQSGKRLPFEFAWSVNGSEPVAVSGSYLVLKPAAISSQAGGIASWNSTPPIDLGGSVSARTRLSGGNVEILLETSAKTTSPADAFAGTGLHFDPMGKPDAWTLPRTVKQDLAVFELVKSASGNLEAMCHFVQGTQAGSGSHLVAGQVQKLIQVKTDRSGDRAAVMLSFPRAVLAPFDPKPGSRLGVNISVPAAGKGFVSLAPTRDYKSASEPGELNLLLLVVGE